MAKLGAKLKHIWNAFIEQDKDYQIRNWDLGAAYAHKPDRTYLRISNERTILASIYTRLSLDVAANQLVHVRLDENGRFVEEMKSGLNECLLTEANVDQGAKAFRQDLALTLFEKGVAAVVAVDASIDPTKSQAFDVKSLRVGEIVQWWPRHVQINLYNDQTGQRENITLPKSIVGIVENPFYNIMNESNSTLQRLIRKLNLLDVVDEASSSGKMDLIIQLPYVIKSEARRQQAEERRKDIEFQLKGSQYGIAYTDGTEKITQLNRPAENNLLKQVEYLMGLLYQQLGLTEEIMNGTASEQVMLNYHNRTIEPVVVAIMEEMKRKFLTKTARTQYQSIISFRDPFKLVPVGSMADIADKLSRNEILTSNEVRQLMGFKPSVDPRADKLQNSNMPVKDLGIETQSPTAEEGRSEEEKGDSQNGS